MKSFKITAGRLPLTKYKDLTLAAQFPDQKLPRRHHEAQYLEFPNGRYALTIR